MEKQMSLIDSIKSLHESYLSCKKEDENLRVKIQKEIEEATKKIKLSYEKKLESNRENLAKKQSEFEDYMRLLKLYSTFDIDMIGEVINKLILIVEGEPYSYQKARHSTYKFIVGPFGGDSFKVNKKLNMVVKETSKSLCYEDLNDSNDCVYNLVRSGSAIVLSESEYDIETVTFYSVDNSYSIKSLINFGNFSYVRDFIDFVIEQRFKNSLDKISEKELMTLMGRFVLNIQEMIKDNYNKRLLEKQELLMQEITSLASSTFDTVLSEIKTLEGEDISDNRDLIERLTEEIKSNVELGNSIRRFEIFYGRMVNEAEFCSSEVYLSSKNIYISKINITSSIKGYYDDSNSDPHFNGECDINLKDDGLVGFVSVSSFGADLDDIISNYFPSNKYNVSRIGNYLRVLYLPNNGEYSHKSVNIYDWILSDILDEPNKPTDSEVVSYEVLWDYALEAKRMLEGLKKVELACNSDRKQLKLFNNDKK